MSDVNGHAAADTMASWSKNTPGLCLYYVWIAYKEHGATSAVTYPTAYSAFLATQRRHYDYNPPKGVPVWLGQRGSSGVAAAGDVCISLGGGRVICTDWPVNGVIGSCTIQERIAQTGRPYLGWSEDFLGNNVLPAEPADVGVEPFPAPTETPSEEEDDMRPITILRVDADGKFIEGCQLHPSIGTDLEQFVHEDEFGDKAHSRTKGYVTTFRGGMVSDNWDVVVGWRRYGIKGDDISNVAEYISAQREYSRFVVESEGKIPEDLADAVVPPVVTPPVVVPPVVVPGKA